MPCWRCRWLHVCAALAAAAGMLRGADLRAVTPESHLVQTTVARGVAFLETHDDSRLGAKALAARVMVLDGRSEHRKVVEALEAIERARPNLAAHDIYSVSLSILLLVERDPYLHREAIVDLVEHLQRVQKPHGGWGYPQRGLGDTSMTQYAVLALWVAQRAGFDVPEEVWVRAVHWLLRTQDHSGAWGYQGVESKGDGPVRQEGIRPTLGLAGLTSLYFGGDRLGLVALSTTVVDLPPAFRPAGPVESPPRSVPSELIDAAVYRAAIERAGDWAAGAELKPGDYFPYYFLYTLERYHAVRESLAGRTVREPSWYNEGVSYLVARQRDDGGWNGNEGPGPATSFAILFLIRSTRKALAVPDAGLGRGTLVGGRGVPTAEGALDLRFGRLAPRPLSGPADELLGLLENPANPEFLRAVATLEEAALPSEDPLGERLRQLAGSDQPAAKAASLRALGRRQDLDAAPLMIAALEDAEPLVFEAALEALRVLSRSLPSAAHIDAGDEVARKREIEHWKAWYRAIRPDTRFEPSVLSPVVQPR